jgi:hypothetical protein
MSDLIDVAEPISNHPSTIAVRGVARWLQADRPGVERAAVRVVDVVDVDVEGRVIGRG